jgi:hypothetical protein
MAAMSATKMRLQRRVAEKDGRRAVRCRYDDAGECRTDRRGCEKGGAVPGYRIRECIERNHLREKRAPRRIVECEHDAAEEETRVGQQNRALPVGHCGETGRRQRDQHSGDSGDAAAVEAVGDVSARQGEQNQRKPRHQADETQRERGMRALIQLPPDGDVGRFASEHGEDAGGEKKAEVAMAQRLVWIVTPAGRRRHRVRQAPSLWSFRPLDES